ncbi:MAG: DUF1838 domain-containing protein [Sphingomonadales bacterium]|nr:DUF1838 domain-containing protein [Sphingomonadales bacterium]
MTFRGMMKRGLAIAAAGLAFTTMGMGQAAGQLDPNDPTDAVKMARKLHCSLEDAKPIVYQWKGRLYSRVQGERDRHLFNLLGMNVRTCGTVTNEARGYGYRMVSREIMLYLDPRTNEVLRSWENPWTGKTVDVIHVANDPVNSRGATHAVGRDGTPFRFYGRFAGGRVFASFEVPLFYTNALGGDYQPYVGNYYHAMEMFNFIIDEDDLLDGGKDTASTAVVTWGRLAQWLPWMEMGARPGIMVANATGRKLPSWDDLDPVMIAEIDANYPVYREPPPLDDTRPNETSWTYFKKILDARQKDTQEGGH